GLEPNPHTQPAFLAIDAEFSHAVRDAADTALRTGQVRRVLPALRQASAQDPLDEAVQARLLLALATDGRQAEAFDLFETVRRRLSEELGVSPGAELLEAYDRLLHQRTGTTSAPKSFEPRRASVAAQNLP